MNVNKNIHSFYASIDMERMDTVSYRMERVYDVR